MPELPEPISDPEPTPEPAPEPVAKYTSEEFTMVVRTVYGEANVCSGEEQALVAWCICNRCDAWDKSISEVVNHAHFHGYDPDNPTPEDVRAVVQEVLDAWSRGETPATYPPYATTTGYLYFWGDGLHNYFREEY